MYRQKRVECIAVIDAVVDVELGVGEAIKWQRQNVDRDAKTLKRTAVRKVDEFRHNSGWKLPFRVFLLGPVFDTDFLKDSPGGMFGSKRYFDVTALRAKDAEDLAKKLRGRVWSAFHQPG